MTDFPAETFPATQSFPTIRRSGSCVLPALMGVTAKNWIWLPLWEISFSFSSCTNTEIFSKCQKWTQKKAANLFRIYCSWLPLRGGGYSVVKIKEGDSTLGYRPLGCTFAKTGGAVNGGRSPFTCRWLARLDLLLSTWCFLVKNTLYWLYLDFPPVLL